MTWATPRSTALAGADLLAESLTWQVGVAGAGADEQVRWCSGSAEVVDLVGLPVWRLGAAWVRVAARVRIARVEVLAAVAVGLPAGAGPVRVVAVKLT